MTKRPKPTEGRCRPRDQVDGDRIKVEVGDSAPDAARTSARAPRGKLAGLVTADLFAAMRSD